MMFTLGNIVCLGFVAIAIIGFSGFIMWALNDGCQDKEKSVLRNVLIFVLEVILIGAMTIGCSFYNTHTESGKRSLKTWDSEKSGGLNRTVTVYDMQGEEIAKYQGKFDVEESQSEGVVKIKFDMNGKRHIIYAQTGTVLIDEN